MREHDFWVRELSFGSVGRLFVSSLRCGFIERHKVYNTLKICGFKYVQRGVNSNLTPLRSPSRRA